MAEDEDGSHIRIKTSNLGLYPTFLFLHHGTFRNQMGLGHSSADKKKEPALIHSPNTTHPSPLTSAGMTGNPESWSEED